MKRQLKRWEEAKVCTACHNEAVVSLAAALPDYWPTLATHSVTDAQEQAAGSWQETLQRHGCAKHPVVSMVRFLSGESISFEEYQRRMAAVSEAICAL